MNATERLAEIERRAAAATYFGGDTQEVADDALALVAVVNAVLAEVAKVRDVHRSSAWIHRNVLTEAIESALGGGPDAA